MDFTNARTVGTTLRSDLKEAMIVKTYDTLTAVP